MSMYKILLSSLVGLSLLAPCYAKPTHLPDKATIAKPDSKTRVSINTASAAQLVAVKGIGQTRAAAIIAYRQQHGPFKSVSDLTHVHRFGVKLLANIKDQITT